MDAVFLSRLQFGLTALFHFIFPPITLGLTLIIFMLETARLRGKGDVFGELSAFFVKLLGTIFVLGVATGIVLEFSFGTNWANYSIKVGDVFGAPLVAEVILSFFIESIFIAVLLFGRKLVSVRQYWFASLVVLVATHLSAFWILAANSWMQTPAGYEMVGMKATETTMVLTDFFAAIFNPSAIERLTHTISSAWLTGGFFAAGVCAWLLINGRNVEHAKLGVKLGLIVIIPAAFLQLSTGHLHSVQVAKTQPEKMAAFEGLWETQKGAPLSLAGLPDEDAETTRFAVGLPKMLSVLVYFDPDAEVKGLKEFPKDERPPVLIVFSTYHAMIGLGTFFIGFAFLAAFMWKTGRAWTDRRFWWLLVLCAPLPHLANAVGWMSAEIGRQPWAVYRLLKTAHATSEGVPGWQVALTLVGFVAVYTLLLFVFVRTVFAAVNSGVKKEVK